MSPSDRIGYLGGSDAAVVLGISPWKTRYQLWCEKTGAEPAPDLSSIDYIYFGHLLEPIVASEFQRRLQKKVREKRMLVKHAKFPFVAGHVDRIVLNEDAILECKTSNAFDYRRWGESGGDHTDIPEYYLAQVDHYMLTTGRSMSYLATLIGGNDFRYYTIERNAEREQRLLEALIKFWTLIQQDDPPEITNEKDAKHRWKESAEGTAVPVDQAMRSKVLRLAVVSKERKELEEEEKALRNVVIPTFTDKELLTESGEPIARLSSYDRKYFDEKKFAEKHPKIAARFTEKRKSKRLKILI
jgi:putative phage-type endonuclease